MLATLDVPAEVVSNITFGGPDNDEIFCTTGNPAVHGRVTGGTGAFRGATGTITARNLNKAGTRTAVTIKYHT